MQPIWRTNMVAMVALVGLCAGGTAGCSTITGAASSTTPERTATARPRPGGRLVYGLEVDPTGLDPTKNAWDNAGIQVANSLYDPLVAYDAAGRPRPYLLSSLSPGPGFTSWVLELRPAVQFHDGTPLDADALLAFIGAMRTSPVIGPAAQLLTGARKLDELRVEVTSSRPWASLPALLSGQGGYVVAPDHLVLLEGHSHPMGTGPFILRTWETNKRLELVRNPRYWRGGLPYLDAVDFVVVEDGAVRLDMIEAGDLDATAVTSQRDIRALDQILDRKDRRSRIARAEDATDAEKTVVVFNTTRAPLNDVRVRQAIGHATDMRAIAEQSHWPLDRIARGPFDPASPYFSPAPYPGPDIGAARQLVAAYLSDSRVRKSASEVTFTLLAPDIWAPLANQLVDQWNRAGIRARVEFTNVKQTMRVAVSGGFDAEILRAFAAPDPDVLWHFFVSDTASTTGASLNLARLRDADITAGMNDGRGTDDDATRRAAYARVQDSMARQLPYLWLQREQWRIATSLRVRDARNVTLPGGGGALPFLVGTNRLTETWLDP